MERGMGSQGLPAAEEIFVSLLPHHRPTRTGRFPSKAHRPMPPVKSGHEPAGETTDGAAGGVSFTAGGHEGLRVYPLVLLACALLASPIAGRADQGWEGHSLNLTWENDATRGSDRHYTQGAKIRYLSSDTAVPGWLQGL